MQEQTKPVKDKLCIEIMSKLIVHQTIKSNNFMVEANETKSTE